MRKINSRTYRSLGFELAGGVGSKSDRNKDGLDAKLAEYAIHAAEIRSRTNLQNRILQIHVTALTIIVGALLTVEDPPLQVVVFIPLAASFAGLWYFDHALAIEGAGTHIATDIEHYIGNGLLKRPGFIRWESSHMIEEIDWPAPLSWKSWGFSELIQATFFIPAFLSLLVAIGVIIAGVIELVPALPSLFVAIGLSIEGVMEFGAAWRTFDRGAFSGSTLVELLIHLIVFPVSVFTLYQFMLLTLHWESEQDSRVQRIPEILVYRFYRSSLDRGWNRSVDEFAAPTYKFRNCSTGMEWSLRQWQHHERHLTEAPDSCYTLKFTRDAAPDGKPSIYQKIKHRGKIRPFANFLYDFSVLTIQFAYTLLIKTPKAAKERYSLQIPPSKIELTVQVTTENPSRSFTDTITLVDGRVAAHVRQTEEEK